MPQTPRARSLDHGDVVVVTQKVVSKAEGRLVAIDPDDPRGAAQARRVGGGPCAAHARRPHHRRDAPRVRLRSSGRGPLERRARATPRCCPSTATSPRSASATTCAPRATSRSVSSCPTRSAGPGGAASPTWPSASRGWRPSSTCAAATDGHGPRARGHRGRGRRRDRIGRRAGDGQERGRPRRDRPRPRPRVATRELGARARARRRPTTCSDERSEREREEMSERPRAGHPGEQRSVARAARERSEREREEMSGAAAVPRSSRHGGRSARSGPGPSHAT